MIKKLKKYRRDVAACLVFSLILYIFYRSVFALILVVPVFIIYRKISARKRQEKYRETLNTQFKDFLVSMSAALRAGYSAENAVSESYYEMKLMYGEDSYICAELRKMLNQISLHVPMEKIFSEFAERTKVEDIQTFASVFVIAKKTGGDLVAIIRKTAADIAAKVETKNEIAIMISSKKFEQNIMNCMPLGIILYISFTSGEILDPLYGNAAGVLIMTLCLGLYAFAFLLSKKIMNIEV